MKKGIIICTLLATLATTQIVAAQKIVVEQVPVYKVISLRKTGSYNKISQMIPKIFQYISSKEEISCCGAPIFICREKSAQEAKEADQTGTADIEVCVPVVGNTENTDEFAVYDLPGGKMAKIMHKGPYGECGKAYEKLFVWIIQNGYTLNGFTREVYLNSPHEVAETDLLTEIYAPVE